MNKGLSKELSKAFSNCNIAPVPRSLIQSEIIPNPYWLVGFVDAEGCFYVKISKHKLVKPSEKEN